MLAVDWVSNTPATVTSKLRGLGNDNKLLSDEWNNDTYFPAVVVTVVSRLLWYDTAPEEVMSVTSLLPTTASDAVDTIFPTGSIVMTPMMTLP